MRLKRVGLILLTLCAILLISSVAFAQGEPENEFDLLQLILDVLGGLLSLVQGLVSWLLEQLRLFFDFLMVGLQEFINLVGNLLRGLIGFLAGILGFIGDVIRFIVELVGGIINAIVSVFRAVWDFLIWAIRNIIEIIEIIGLIIQIIVGLIGLVLGWIGQVVGIIFGIFATLQGAPPTAIPGMPLCVSAPLEHDLCAVWYMLSHTIFAEGTGGAITLLIVILMVDLWIVFYVINQVIALSRVAMEVFRSVV